MKKKNGGLISGSNLGVRNFFIQMVLGAARPRLLDELGDGDLSSVIYFSLIKKNELNTFSFKPNQGLLPVQGFIRVCHVLVGLYLLGFSYNRCIPILQHF